jgi:hypothetical protein
MEESHIWTIQLLNLRLLFITISKQGMSDTVDAI